jgi:hypothetical protein
MAEIVSSRGKLCRLVCFGTTSRKLIHGLIDDVRAPLAAHDVPHGFPAAACFTKGGTDVR